MLFPLVQGLPKKNTRLENVIKLDLKLSLWDKNTSMDAQDNGEVENVDFTLFGCVMVEHCNVFGATFIFDVTKTYDLCKLL